MDAVLTWMWEARAAPGRVADLASWARSVTADSDTEIYQGLGESSDLVVILLHLPEPAGPAPDGHCAPLPAPPPELLAGTAHAWPFARVDGPSRQASG